ncbi:MAG TPA: response regulator [Gemmatirosa sp.]
MPPSHELPRTPAADPAPARASAPPSPPVGTSPLGDAPADDPHAATAMRLEALGLLAGGVAHDFNNILAVIRANVELARDALSGRPADVSVALSDLGEVDRAVERASELVRQLLAFGRRQRLAPEALDLNAVVRETLALVRVLVGDTARIVVRPASEVPHVRADRPHVEQVLVSLVLNARDAIADAQVHRDAAERTPTDPPAGTLTVSTCLADVAADDVTRFGVPRPGRYSCLVVHDTGIGMDAATRARIFEPFFTTKTVDRGAGLGLAATWGIVRQSGGGIHVDSEPGFGSTFTVYLPAIEVAALPTTEEGAQAVLPARPSTTPPFSTAAVTPIRGEDGRASGPREMSGPTVLLAEDDHAVRRATSRILRGAGYQVLEAGDGRSALALWHARAREVDVLVADLRMPHLRGDALARAVRAERPELPVVLMTGFAEEPSVRGATADGIGLTPRTDGSGELGDVPVLAKPFGSAELLGHVAASLAARAAS